MTANVETQNTSTSLEISSDPLAACLFVVGAKQHESSTSSEAFLAPIADVGTGQTKSIEIVVNGVKRVIVLPVVDTVNDNVVATTTTTTATATTASTITVPVTTTSAPVLSQTTLLRPPSISSVTTVQSTASKSNFVDSNIDCKPHLRDLQPATSISSSTVNTQSWANGYTDQFQTQLAVNSLPQQNQMSANSTNDIYSRFIIPNTQQINPFINYYSYAQKSSCFPGYSGNTAQRPATVLPQQMIPTNNGVVFNQCMPRLMMPMWQPSTNIAQQQAHISAPSLPVAVNTQMPGRPVFSQNASVNCLPAQLVQQAFRPLAGTPMNMPNYVLTGANNGLSYSYSNVGTVYNINVQRPPVQTQTVSNSMWPAVGVDSSLQRLEEFQRKYPHLSSAIPMQATGGCLPVNNTVGSANTCNNNNNNSIMAGQVRPTQACGIQMCTAVTGQSSTRSSGTNDGSSNDAYSQLIRRKFFVPPGPISMAVSVASTAGSGVTQTQQLIHSTTKLQTLTTQTPVAVRKYLLPRASYNRQRFAQFCINNPVSTNQRQLTMPAVIGVISSIAGQVTSASAANVTTTVSWQTTVSSCQSSMSCFIPSLINDTNLMAACTSDSSRGDSGNGSEFTSVGSSTDQPASNDVINETFCPEPVTSDALDTETSEQLIGNCSWLADMCHILDQPQAGSDDLTSTTEVNSSVTNDKVPMKSHSADEMRKALLIAKSIGKGMHHKEEESKGQQQRRHHRRKQQLTSLEYDDTSTCSSDSWRPDGLDSLSTSDKTSDVDVAESCSLSSGSWSSNDSLTMGRTRCREVKTRQRRRTRKATRYRQHKRRRTRRLRTLVEDDFDDSIYSDCVKSCYVDLECMDLGSHHTVNVRHVSEYLCCTRHRNVRRVKRLIDSDESSDGDKTEAISNTDADGGELIQFRRAKKVPRIDDSDSS